MNQKSLLMSDKGTRNCHYLNQCDCVSKIVVGFIFKINFRHVELWQNEINNKKA